MSDLLFTNCVINSAEGTAYDVCTRGWHRCITQSSGSGNAVPLAASTSPSSCCRWSDVVVAVKSGAVELLTLNDGPFGITVGLPVVELPLEFEVFPKICVVLSFGSAVDPRTMMEVPFRMQSNIQ